jgi:hypothetical protein
MSSTIPDGWGQVTSARRPPAVARLEQRRDAAGAVTLKASGGDHRRPTVARGSPPSAGSGVRRGLIYRVRLHRLCPPRWSSTGGLLQFVWVLFPDFLRWFGECLGSPPYPPVGKKQPTSGSERRPAPQPPEATSLGSPSRPVHAPQGVTAPGHPSREPPQQRDARNLPTRRPESTVGGRGSPERSNGGRWAARGWDGCASRPAEPQRPAAPNPTAPLLPARRRC